MIYKFIIIFFWSFSVMPKIPTFTSEARPTAQAASVVSNIQIPLNETVAGALRPLGKAAEDYYIKEKQIETKVQAGELNADATVEVFNAASEAELKNYTTRRNRLF